jgi:hypothetical protein
MYFIYFFSAPWLIIASTGVLYGINPRLHASGPAFVFLAYIFAGTVVYSVMVITPNQYLSSVELTEWRTGAPGGGGVKPTQIELPEAQNKLIKMERISTKPAIAT